jgi:hypothetical protein
LCPLYKNLIYYNQDTGAYRANPVNIDKPINALTSEYDYFDIEILLNTEEVQSALGFRQSYQVYNEYVWNNVFGNFREFSSMWAWRGLERIGYRLKFVSGERDWAYNWISVKMWTKIVFDGKELILHAESEEKTCWEYSNLEFEVVKDSGRFVAIDQPSVLFESLSTFVENE